MTSYNFTLNASHWNHVVLGERNKYIKIHVNLTSDLPCGYTIVPLSHAAQSVVVQR